MSKPLSYQERVELGQHQRKTMRRAEHAEWNPKLRKDDPLQLLKVAEEGRVPDLIKLKHERMLASPFAFFRGAVPIMAYDLSLVANTGLHNQICGDAHVRNLGAYASPDGRILFDINDFDETVQAPFEWDVKRMATSLILAGREAGIKDGHATEAAAAMLERYRNSILTFAQMPLLDVARYQVHRLGDVSPVADILHAAQRATPMQTLAALTTVAGNSPAKRPRKKAARKAPAAPADAAPGRLFKSNPPLLKRVTGADAEAVTGALPAYVETLLPVIQHLFSRYTVVDVAFKVVGTGSVGLRDYCVYMEGNGPNDPLFIQVKEEAPSAYARYVGDAAVAPSHNGRRVVEGERSMQLQSDPFLGWTQIDGRDFMVRQLADHKASVDLTNLKASSLLEYGAVCGELLARGHSRSGDAAVLAGYLGDTTRFDEAILAFAIAYAEQTEHDHKLLTRAMKKHG